jgi:hypothetical protein
MWLLRRTTPDKKEEPKHVDNGVETLKDKLAKMQLPEQPKPVVRQEPTKLIGVSNLINETHFNELKKALPLHPQTNDWHLLYDSAKMGLAITSFCDRVLGRGPTVLIIKDTDGHIFGCFGSESWKKSTKYYGNSSCFLFQIQGEKVNIFPATQSNTNYMYFNMGNQYNPYNGLAMGGTGKFDYFPLALDKNFSSGESRGSLRTFGSPCLLGEDALEDTFKIDCIEAWGFPLTESDRINLEYEQTTKEEKRGVLNSDDNADLYFMQQAGRVGEGANYKAEVDQKK